MKQHNAYGFRFPLPDEAAAQLDKAAAAIAGGSQPSAPATQAPDVLFEATAAQVNREKAAAHAPTEQVFEQTITQTETKTVLSEFPKLSIGAQFRVLMMKVFGLIFVRPLRFVGGMIASPFMYIKRRHDTWADANPIKSTLIAAGALVGCILLLMSVMATPTTSMVRVHGGLENGGIFSRLGFALDTGKSTEIQVTGWAGNREIKATALVDSKGRYYTPGSTGGWFRHK